MKLHWFAISAAAALLCSAETGAQQASPIDAGGWIVGGSAGLSRTHDSGTNQTNTSFRLSPSALRFFQDRFAFGGSANFGYFSSAAGNTTTYGLGPNARYYFGERTGKLFPFLSATVSPQWQRGHSTVLISGNSTSTNLDARLLSLDGSAGRTRIVAANVGLTGEAYYSRSSYHFDRVGSAGDQNTYDFGLRFGVTVFAR